MSNHDDNEDLLRRLLDETGRRNPSREFDALLRAGMAELASPPSLEPPADPNDMNALIRSKRRR